MLSYRQPYTQRPLRGLHAAAEVGSETDRKRVHISLAEIAVALLSATRRSGLQTSRRLFCPSGCFPVSAPISRLRPAAFENHTFGPFNAYTRPTFPPNPQYRRRPFLYIRTRPHAGYADNAISPTCNLSFNYLSSRPHILFPVHPLIQTLCNVTG